MIDKAQMDMAKGLWEQAKAAAMQGHQAWDMVLQSQKTMLNSMRGLGAPYAMAADQFEKLMQFQAEQYKATLAQMEKMSEEYAKLLEKGMKR